MICNITYRNQAKSGTVTAADVLSGKTFTSSAGVGLTGTMANKGAWTNTPTGSGKVTIPAGYHNGNGYVDTSTVYTNGYNTGYEKAKTEKTFSGSANLITGDTSDGGITTPSFSLNVTDYNSITINVTSVTNNNSSLTINANNGISQKVGPGTYSYDISSATTITFTSNYNISKPSNCAFNYTLK